jgi:futalosine hydrolase
LAGTAAGGSLEDGGPLLIVAAWAPELRALGRVFSQGKSRHPVSTGRTASGALSAVRVSGAAPVRAVVGVGLCEAAAGTARLIERQRPRAVVLVGTAGLYPGADKDRGAPAGLTIGSAVLARTFHLASDSVARQAAYLPEPLPAEAASTPELLQEVAAATSLPIVDVACPIGITRAATLAQQLRKSTGAALENLEGFAVARAAASAGVPFVALLGIANHVGPEGNQQWRTHGTAAAAAACSAVRTWLAAT